MLLYGVHASSHLPRCRERRADLATGDDANGNAKTAFPNDASLDSYNACTSSTSCGTSASTIAAGDFVSLDPTNAGFLRLAASSAPIDHGATLTEVTSDYAGNARTAGSYDIGAFEQGN